MISLPSSHAPAYKIAERIGGGHAPEIGSHPGLETLVTAFASALTPDTKIITLLGMQEGKVYSSARQVYSDVGKWLVSVGVTRTAMPVTPMALWGYLGRGLVKDGLIIRQNVFGEDQGSAIGYEISPLGGLVKRLGERAILFLYDVSNSATPPRYDSMLRIFGNSQSRTERKRPFAVCEIVKFLVEHEGWHRARDLVEAFDGKLDDRVVSLTLTALGKAGIIRYESTMGMSGGMWRRGLAEYRLASRRALNSDGTAIAETIRRIRPSFKETGGLRAVLGFIRDHPAAIYESNGMSQLSGMPPQQIISKVLSALSLSSVGIIKQEGTFRSRSDQSSAEANDLTLILFEALVLPIYSLASSQDSEALEPRQPTAAMIKAFLQNYGEESPHKTQGDGERVRTAILDLTTDLGSRVRLSRIVEEVNKRLGLDLTPSAYRSHLGVLEKRGLATRQGKGLVLLRPRGTGG